MLVLLWLFPGRKSGPCCLLPDTQRATPAWLCEVLPSQCCPPSGPSCSWPLLVSLSCVVGLFIDSCTREGASLLLTVATTAVLMALGRHRAEMWFSASLLADSSPLLLLPPGTSPPSWWKVAMFQVESFITVLSQYTTSMSWKFINRA